MPLIVETPCRGCARLCAILGNFSLLFATAVKLSIHKWVLRLVQAQKIPVRGAIATTGAVLGVGMIVSGSCRA
jgi:hypothetical protein